MANFFDYQFNIGGNFSAQMSGMIDSTNHFEAKIQDCNTTLGRFANTLATWDMASNYVLKMDSAFSGMFASGVRLDKQMHDLSAVAGVTGEGLKQIEGYARESAKAFGTDASTAVEGYKLLLSQLSPELGKYPEALQAMGNCIQTTSKLMGNDGVAAAEVLTTAMNQYGVSLANPTKASEEMARMMNVMAAAGQAGSAELPAIKVALEQCGMAAKAANVSFEETNAAIQVLDKAGKKGSEGGVALRNVLSTLGQGRFLPKKTHEELKKAGIDVNDLADKTKPLKERLEGLKPLLDDDALLSALFGKENANAARALVQGTDALQDFTDAVTGTSSAEEQAAIVMESYAERQARVNQQFEDFKIRAFQATGDLSLWVSTITGALIPISQLMPLVVGLGNGMLWVKNLKWAAMWGGIVNQVRNAVIALVLMTDQTALANGISLGFIGNVGRMTFQLARFATVGLWNGIKALGAYALSLVTGGTASATFAATSATAFGTFKLSAVSACRAVSVAIMSIPIIGWIAAAIAGIIALGVYFWNTSVKFRAVLKGLGAAFVAVFKGIWKIATGVFGGIGDLIRAAFSLDFEGIKRALNRMRGGYAELGSSVGKAFNDAYNAEMKGGGKKQAGGIAKQASASPLEVPEVNPTGNTLRTTADTSDSSGGGRIKNVTISVEKLVERFEIHTTNLSEDMSRVKEMVSGALLSALNDVNLAM